MMRWLRVLCFTLTSLLFAMLFLHYYTISYRLADPAPEHISLLTDEQLLKMLNQYSTYLGELLQPAVTQYTKLVSQLKEPPPEAEVISSVLEILSTLTHLQDIIAVAQILEGSEGNKSDVIMSSSNDVIMSPSDEVLMPFRVKEPPKCPDTETFLVEMERRREHLKTHCKEKSPALRSKISTLQRKTYFKKSKLYYCPVFKSASTSVLAYFCFDYFTAESCLETSGFGRYSKFVVPRQQTGSSRFVVVRDPLTRLLSAYRDKIELFKESMYIKMVKEMLLNHRRVLWTKYPSTNITTKTKSKLCDVALKHATTIHDNIKRAKSHDPKQVKIQLSDSNPYDHPPYPTFTEFVSAVLMGTENPHWNPSTRSCGPCGPDKPDFIVRSEQLECELHNMLNVTNNSAVIQTFQESWTATHPHVAPSHTSPSMFYRYYSTLTDDQLEGLGEYYRLDCELYEYDCVEELARIKLFKLANPGYKHIYDSDGHLAAKNILNSFKNK